MTFRNRLLPILVVAVIVLAAFFLGRASLGGPQSRPPVDAPEVVDEPGPTDEINGVPVGYARTEEGAVAAATEFSVVMARASSHGSNYVRAMSTLAAPEWRNEAVTVAENGEALLKKQYGVGASATFSPIRFRVVEYSHDTATVEVWGVSLAGPSGLDRFDNSWVTGRLHLLWTEGDWRVLSQSSVSGPTPTLLQNVEGPSPSRLVDFETYVSGPAA